MTTEPAGVAEEWQRRFVADAARAEEAMQLYRQLGYEVYAEPVRPDEPGSRCETCLLAARTQLKVIYTRRRRT